MLNFEDGLARAAWRALDADVPEELLPLTVSNQAALWAGMEAEESTRGEWWH